MPDKLTKKDGNSSFLNSLLSSQKTSQSKKENNSNSKNASKGNNTQKNIKNFFLTPSTSNQNESFSSTMSFESTVLNPAEIPELSQMVSVLETRRKSLEEKKAKISEIKEVHEIKNVLLDILSDVTKCVEDSDKILQCHNKLVRSHNDTSAVIQSSSKSIDNLSNGIGNLTDSHNDLKTRIQSLEVAKDCAFDGLFVNIILVDEKEAEEIENGSIGPKQKFTKIMSDMKIMPPKEVVDAKLITGRKFINGTRKLIKILRVRFCDSVTPSRIFSQIVTYNKELAKTGQHGLVKYYVETPTSKNVWILKRICYELKNDGILHSVRGCDRGILVSYKVTDEDKKKTTFRSIVVTSEKDIDNLRISLNVEDAYIPVNEKYNADFWSSKKAETTQKKRKRDTNEVDDASNAKKGRIPSSTPKRD
ncbi:hypothetical protein ACKWTF_016457 [Chironomus riparius]